MRNPQFRGFRREGKNHTTVVLMVVSLGLAGCDGAANPADAEQDPAAASGHTTPSRTEEVSFDIPALMGKSIDEVREILGTPHDRTVEPTQLQLDVGIHEWTNVFSRNGQNLLVTFDTHTRRVVDFFLVGTDQAALVRRGNLDQRSSAYLVEPVRARRDASKITGVKITSSH
jgi:hypothetical protein